MIDPIAQWKGIAFACQRSLVRASPEPKVFFAEIYDFVAVWGSIPLQNRRFFSGFQALCDLLPSIEFLKLFMLHKGQVEES